MRAAGLRAASGAGCTRTLAGGVLCFDCGGPWTYLAFHKIEVLAAETGAELVWKPILVGGVFNAVNRGVYEARANPAPARAKYHAKDLADWARHYGLTIGWPKVFPV